MNVKKFYVFIAVSSLIAYVIARERIPFSDVFFTYSDNYDSFSKAFDDRFDSSDDVWMVLGNRGTTDYYRERFSKNWIYWDDHSSSDNLGITGDYLNTENWVEISKNLPKKVSYIATDFNDLVNNSKRNKVIIASKHILKQGGIFCIEDEFDNNKKKFDHFSEEDLANLGKEFKIRYAYWDGYISALPYTCDQSVNKKTDMYKGLETMILRLAAAEVIEKRKLLPHITPRLYLCSLRIKKSMIAKLIRDIINSNYLTQMVRRYELAHRDQEDLNARVGNVNAEIDVIKKEISKLEKIIKFSKNISNRVNKFSNRLNRFSSKMGTLSKSASILAGRSNLLGEPEPEARNSLMSRFSNAVNKKDSNGNNAEEQLKIKQKELEDKQKELEELNFDLNGLSIEIKNIEERIMRYNDACFVKFEKDKYLKKFLSYKKTKLGQIISDNKKSNIEFWDNYDSKAFFHIESISDTEIIARELEKSWSPDVITQNTVSLEDIKANKIKNMGEKTKVILLFEKR